MNRTRALNYMSSLGADLADKEPQPAWLECTTAPTKRVGTGPVYPIVNAVDLVPQTWRQRTTAYLEAWRA
jgi:hypothetical protein